MKICSERAEWMPRTTEKSVSAWGPLGYAPSRAGWMGRFGRSGRGGGGGLAAPGGLQADPFYPVGVALPVFFYFYPQV